MSRRGLSPAEQRRILALPSPLQRETRIALLRVVGERTIPQETAEDRAAWGEMRKWLEGRPHVDYCRCAECRGKAAAE